MLILANSECENAQRTPNDLEIGPLISAVARHIVR